MADSSDANALILQVSADVSKLQKQFDKATGIVNTGSKNMERRAQQASTTIEGYFGKTSISGALDKIVDTSRLKVFDSATARIGLTGQALEMLGPAGLAAAAGVVAVGAAFAEARGAAKFADDIQDTAARLHVTTDALQEFRYANFQAGGSMEGADQALEAFSGNLGKAQEGLKKGQRAFLALGFTKDQINSFKSADVALQAVTVRIAQLKNDPQKDALIDQLGLTGMKPLILEGVSAMEQLRQQAHAIGIVMDSDLVQRGAEANKQFEVLSKVIDVQLKSAFIDLAPVLVGLLGYVASFVKGIGEAVDLLRSIDKRTTAGLVDKRNQALNDIADLQNGKGPVPGFVRNAYLAKRGQQVDDINAELTRRAATAIPPTIPHGTRSLIDQSPVKKGPTDRSSTILDQLTQQQIAAAQAIVTNMLEFAKTYDPQDLTVINDLIDQQAKAESDAVQAAKKKALDQIDLDVKNKSLRGEAIEQARSAVEKTAVDKQTVIDAKTLQEKLEALWKEEDFQLAYAKEIRGFYSAISENNSAMADSSAERRAIELRQLKADQAQELKDIEDRRQRELDAAKLSQDPIGNTAEINSRYDATKASAQDKQASDTAKKLFDTAGPIEQYERSLKNLDDQFQTFAVEGVKGLSDALANALFDSKNFASSMASVFKQLFAQILSAEIQKNVFAPFLSALGLGSIGHNAGGTDYWQGGLTVVGEKGPELINLQRGAQVIPNNVMNSMTKMPPARAAAGPTVVINFDAKDAVLSQTVQQWINQGVRQGMAYTNQMGRVLHKTIPSEAGRNNANALR